MGRKLLKEEQATFLLKYGGEDDISAYGLGTSLRDLSVILEELAKFYNNEAFLKFKITSLSPGCVTIDFLVAAGTSLVDIVNFFGAPNLTLAWNCVKSLIETFKILKEEAASENGSVNVNDNQFNLNNSGTLNLFVGSNPELRRSAINFCAMAENEGREDILIQAGEEEVFLSKDDLTRISGLKSEEGEKTELENVTTPLTIVSPVFQGKKKWTFYYNDKMIQATISDSAFLDGVQNGKFSFNGETKLEVKMQIEIIKGSDGKPIKDKTKYNVLEVLNQTDFLVGNNSKQQTLF